MSIFDTYQASVGKVAAPAPTPVTPPAAAAPTTDPFNPFPVGAKAPVIPPVPAPQPPTPAPIDTGGVYAKYQAATGEKPAPAATPVLPLPSVPDSGANSASPETTAPAAGGPDKGLDLKPYFAATDSSGNSFGFSDQLDSSGIPYFAYRAPGDTSTTTDTTRVAVSGFDPRVAQPLSASTFLTPRAVAARASLKASMGGTYSDELDHVIALELAGSNNKANLQIEPDVPGTNNTATDPLENTLAKNVATGKMSLFQAQTALAQAKGKAAPFTGVAPAKPPSFLGDVGADFNAIKNTYSDLAQKVGGVFSDFAGAKDNSTEGIIKNTIEGSVGLPIKAVQDFVGTPAQTNPGGLAFINAQLPTVNSIIATLGPKGNALKTQADALTAAAAQVDQTNQASVDTYNAKVNEFNSALSQYNFQGAEAPKIVKAFNDAVTAYNNSVSEGTGAIGGYESAVAQAPTKVAANSPGAAGVVTHAAVDNLVSTIQDSGNKLGQVWADAENPENVSNTQVFADAAEGGLGLLNGAFSLITATLAGMSKEQGVVGEAADKVNELFSALGAGASNTVVQNIVNNLPVPEATKASLRQPLGDVAALVAQILVGDKVNEKGIAATKPLVDKLRPILTTIGEGLNHLKVTIPDADLRAEPQSIHVGENFVPVKPTPTSEVGNAPAPTETSPHPTTALEAHQATIEQAQTGHTPLPADHPANLAEADALAHYHLEDMGKPAEGLENIAEARHIITTLEGELKSAHPDANLRTPEQNVMQEHLDALKQYVTDNKTYERYWSGTVKGDTMTRAERALAEPSSNQSARYVERYSGDVLDAIERGHDVPQAVIDQKPTFGEAAAARDNSEMAREATFGPLRESSSFKEGNVGRYDLPVSDVHAAVRSIFPDPREIDFLFPGELRADEGYKLGGRYTPERAFRNPLIELVQKGGRISSHTLYHESFHHFFDQFLSDSEKQTLLNNVKKNLLTAPARGLSRLTEHYANADKRAEEWLANDFAKFMQEKQGLKENHTLYQKMRSLLQGLIRKVSGLKATYERIAAGDRSFHKPARLFTGREVPSYAEDTSRDEDKPQTTEEKLAELKSMRDVYDEQIAQHPAKELQKYVSKTTGMLPEVTGKDTMRSHSDTSKTIKNSAFGQHGDDYITEEGYIDLDHAQRGINGLMAMKEQRADIHSQIVERTKQQRLDKTAKTMAEMKTADTLVSKNKLIDNLLTTKKGEVKGALSNPKIGSIDLTWGTTEGEGGGLSKIAKFHPEVIDKLPAILEKAQVVGGREGRIYLETADGYRAVVRTDFDGKPKQWLLTAYKKDGQGEGSRTPSASFQTTNDTGSPHPENASIPQAPAEATERVDRYNETNRSGNLTPAAMAQRKLALSTPPDLARARQLGELHAGYNEYRADVLRRGGQGVYAKPRLDTRGNPIGRSDLATIVDGLHQAYDKEPESSMGRFMAKHDLPPDTPVLKWFTSNFDGISDEAKAWFKNFVYRRRNVNIEVRTLMAVLKKTVGEKEFAAVQKMGIQSLHDMDGVPALDSEGKPIFDHGVQRFRVAPKRSGVFGKIADAYKKMLDDEQAAGVPVRERQNYQPLYTELTPKQQEEEAKVLAALPPGRRIGLRPGFSMQREFNTYAEAMEAGRQPTVHDALEALQERAKEHFHAMANAQMWNEGVDAGYIVPSEMVNANKALIFRDSPGGQFADYNPARVPQRRTTYIERGSGTEHTNTQGWMGPKPIVELINNYLGEPEGSGQKLLAGTARLAGLARNFVLGVGIPKTAISAHYFNVEGRDIFADLAAGKDKSAALGHSALWTVRPTLAAKFLDDHLEEIMPLYRAGQLFTSSDWNVKEPGTPPTWLGKLGTKYEQGSAAWHNWFGGNLFESYLPARMAETGLRLKDKYIGEGMEEGAAYYRAAQEVNDIYGHVDAAALGRDKTLQNIIRSLALAPSFLENNARLGAKVLRGIGEDIRLKKPLVPGTRDYALYAKYGYAILGVYAAANIINQENSGKWMFQNDPLHQFDINFGTDAKGKTRYVGLVGTGADFIRLPLEIAAAIAQGKPQDITSSVRNRASTVMGPAISLAANSDWLGDPILGPDKYGKPQSPGTQVANLFNNTVGAEFPGQFQTAQEYVGGKISTEQAITGGLGLPAKYKNEQPTASDLAAATANTPKAQALKAIVPIYNKLHAQTATDPAGAQAAYDALTPEQKTAYQKYKASQKAKTTVHNEAQILSTYEKAQAMKAAGNDAGAQALYDALSPADQHAYQLVKARFAQ